MTALDEGPTEDWIASIVAAAALDGAPAITQIARRTFGVHTLETRNSDALDFHECAVWSMRSALAEAFDRGRATGAVEATLAAERDALLDAATCLAPLQSSPTEADVLVERVGARWEARLHDRSAQGPTPVAALRALRLEHERLP